MEAKKCRCTNFSLCSKADNKEIIDIPVGRELKCPECGFDLDEIKGSNNGNRGRLLLMIGVAVVIVVVGGILFFLRGESPTTVVSKTGKESNSSTALADKSDKDKLPFLTSISINGPSTVEENKTANYSTSASYKEGDAKEVEGNWSVSPDTYASISTKGVLTTKSIPSDQNITITVEYSEGGVAQKATTSVVITKVIANKSAPGKQKASVDEINKLSAKLNFQQGMNYVQSEDYGNAIKEFTAAIDKFPDYSSAYANRAVAYMQQKKFNLAADDLKKALELTPQDPNVYYNLTALYSLQKQLDLALGALDKGLEYGFNNYDSLRKDPDLKNLRKHPE
jgi:uncharacterized protein (UPF0333 family)